MKKRIFTRSRMLVAGCVLASSSAVLGTTSAQAAARANTVTITWWGDADYAMDVANKQMVKDFEKAYPNIKVNYQSFPYAAYIPKLQAAFAAHQAPDVAQVFGSWMPQYEKNGLLAPVPNRKEYLNRYFPPTTAGYMYQGVLYGLPHEFNIENGAMLAYPAMFKAKHLAYPPKTWSQIISEGEKLTVKQGNQLKVRGFDFVNSDSVMFLFLADILQQGATYWGSGGHVNFTSPAAVKAMTFETDLITKYHLTDLSELSNPNLDSSDIFFKGGSAMSMRGPWVIPTGQQQYKLHNFDYIPMPSFDSKHPPIFAAESGWGEVVSAQSQQKQADWTFVNFLMSKPEAEKYDLMSYKLPADQSIANDPNFLKTVPLMKPSLDATKYGRPIGMVWDRDFLANAIFENFQSIVSGKETVTQGLQKIQDSVNNMIDQHTH